MGTTEQTTFVFVSPFCRYAGLGHDNSQMYTVVKLIHPAIHVVLTVSL